MKYKFLRVEDSEFKSATVKTMDEKVVSASTSFEWAIGKHISTVIEWATSRGFTWKVSE